jgi:SAM-dependent methyltransferase
MRRNLPLILVLLALAGAAVAYYELKIRDVNPDVPFVVTPPGVVDRMLEVAGVTKDDVVYDLGCGDGRIVIAAAKKYGCKAFGFDINPDLVSEARANAEAAGVADLVTIHRADIFDLDLREASVVTLFLSVPVNARLIPQLQQLRPGSRIVSFAFHMPGIKPRHYFEEDIDGRRQRIYLWVTPLEKE